MVCRTAVSVAVGLLVVVLRGHGRGHGELLMSDSKPLGPSYLLARLRNAGFSGTLLCVFNMCRADTQPEQLTLGWDAATFKWATLHSCDGDDDQAPEHGEQVTRLLAHLLSAAIKQRSPLNQALVSNLWAQLEQEHPTAGKSAAWRAAPILQLSRGFDGQL